MENLSTLLDYENKRSNDVVNQILEKEGNYQSFSPKNYLETYKSPRFRGFFQVVPIPIAKDWMKAITKEPSGTFRCDILMADESEILKVISEAEEYLDWKEDWDDNGAKPFERKTFERAKKFLLDCNRYIRNKFNFKIKAPDILPGQNGSFKIFWDISNFKLLLTIPENDLTAISYYGEDNTKTQTIEGKFTESVHATGLFIWIYEEMKNVTL